MKSDAKIVLVTGLVCAALATTAEARLWKPADWEVAQDYATITHNKGLEGRVVIHWFASPTFTSATLAASLDKYVVLSIAHSHFTPTGTTVFDDVVGEQVMDGQGRVLREIPQTEVPVSLVGLIAVLQAGYRNAGPTAQNVRFLVFEAGGVGACQSGKLIVAYEGERYEFDAPLPGCPKT